MVQLRAFDAAPHRTLRVALIEHDMPAQQRWRQAFYFAALRRYVALSRTAAQRDPATLMIWPEFASSFYVDRNPMVQLELAQLARSTAAALMIGEPRVEDAAGTTRYYNSAFAFASSGHLLGSYDRQLLLPFAEHRPASPRSSHAPATCRPNSVRESGRRSLISPERSWAS